jgi:hypothetical protein
VFSRDAAFIDGNAGIEGNEIASCSGTSLISGGNAGIPVSALSGRAGVADTGVIATGLVVSSVARLLQTAIAKVAANIAPPAAHRTPVAHRAAGSTSAARFPG